jgi:uncharacterized protein YnzC (UPF0291/DUF896 family)
MTEKTKACNLTVDEIETLLKHYGLYIMTDNSIERINYLNKRLKTFNETEVVLTEATKGWGNPNG